MADNLCRNCGSSLRYVATTDGAFRCLNCNCIVDDGEAAVWAGAYAHLYPNLPMVLVGEGQFKLGRKAALHPNRLEGDAE
ncbi:MAG: hypothetical protein RIC55_02230 [Pirellulaceae bacterium]